MRNGRRHVRVIIFISCLLFGGFSSSSADLFFWVNGDRVSGRVTSFHPLADGSPIPPVPSSHTREGVNPPSFPSGQGLISLNPANSTQGTGSGSNNVEKEPEGQPSGAAPPPRPLGPRPEEEEDIRKVFLRQASVLLRPGQWEAEGGLSYLGTQKSSAVLNIKLRQFQLPLTLRGGLLAGLEGFVSIAYLFNRQELSFAETTSPKTKSGWGDAIWGGNVELFRETGALPQTILTLRVKSPTGEPPRENELSLGSGHWGVSLGLQWIKTSDPVVLFWGIQYTHEFAARHYYNDGQHLIRPGETFAYNLGFGFAVNENISLSTQVLGSYQGETVSDGATLAGTASEPVSFRSALTYRWSKKFFLEPSLTIGLNEDTPDFTLAISFTRRF